MIFHENHKKKMNYKEIITFWFDELSPKQHFTKDDNLDREIKDRFLDIHITATKGELFNWRETPLGRLAEIIILDQFSRNIFRDLAKAFETDTLALILAQEAIKAGADKELTMNQRSFCYMPFMHSESPIIHEEAVKLFSQKGLEYNLEFEIKHKEIIDRFGRYPHRNDILKRQSTAEELEFLKMPRSSF